MKATQDRYIGPLLMLVLLCLSFAVLNWGLQYKMSLYHADHGTHAPAAKLWIGRTGVTSQEAALSDQQHPAQAFPAAFLVFLFVFVRSLSIDSNSRTSFTSSRGSVPETRMKAVLNFFFFRPPPARS